MYQLAEEHQALMLDVEHRFYGLSYPTTDMSIENLEYLSAEQGLADLARIIAFVKQMKNTDSSKVVPPPPSHSSLPHPLDRSSHLVGPTLETLPPGSRRSTPTSPMAPSPPLVLSSHKPTSLSTWMS
jgi:hypothetical protein